MGRRLDQAPTTEKYDIVSCLSGVTGILSSLRIVEFSASISLVRSWG